jgi:HD-GYP domain-containing protein (c-di-GMP phosphodiesterase class II)
MAMQEGDTTLSVILERTRVLLQARRVDVLLHTGSQSAEEAMGLKDTAGIRDATCPISFTQGAGQYIAHASLIAHGTLQGTLRVARKQQFQEADLHVLTAMADIAAHALAAQQQMARERQDMHDKTLEGWIRALELRDHETEEHTRRVTEMSVELARMLGLPDDILVHVRRGALLHDIGKLAVPDSILRKPGALTGEEWHIMRLHPHYAYELLMPIDFLKSALEIPLYHHEKWDGTGYPYGLQGEFIPLSARIFAVIDVWDALCFDRPYRLAWPAEKVRQHIISSSGTHFDPAVVQAFLSLIDQHEPVAPYTTRQPYHCVSLL